MNSKRSNIMHAIGVVGVIALFLAPLLWMLLASFKNNVDIHNPGSMFVFQPTLNNYENVFGQQNFSPYIINSFIVGFSATALSLLAGLPAAYSMSRFSMKKSAGVVLLARIIPAVSLLVPWYFIFANMGLAGTYRALIMTHIFVSLPLIIWILMSYFDAMPIELEEAAQVDGLTPIGAFLRITLRLAVPGMATAGILSFIFSWNNFIFALVLSDENTRTLPVAIYNFISYASVDWGGLMAAAVVITIPIILIALFTQRFIISGLTAGATKG